MRMMVMVANGDAESLFGLVLLNDEAVQMPLDIARGELKLEDRMGLLLAAGSSALSAGLDCAGAAKLARRNSCRRWCNCSGVGRFGSLMVLFIRHGGQSRKRKDAIRREDSRFQRISDSRPWR